MNLNVSDWKEFRFGDLIEKPYKAKAFNKDDLELAVNGGVRYITRTGVNNGCEMIVNISDIPEKYVEKENAISIGDTTATCFYQDEDFITGDHMVIVRAKWLNRYTGLFIVGMLQNEQYKYSYGRAFLIDRIQETMMKLPIQHNPDGTPYIDSNHTYSEDGYVPDWQFMEDYMKSLHHKPLTTKNTVGNGLALKVDEWEYFYLKDICDISMGNKMDWSAMTMDNPKVDFVGRSADDNGVAGKVDLVEGVEPYESGCITVALGGSLGASYVQHERFYTSQNVSVLQFEDGVSDSAKLFISCLIMNESKYKYFPFGRELNTHIRTDFGFTLPIQHNPDGTPYIDPNHTYSEDGYVPDWQFMEDYMKALPYGDRL